MGSAVFEELGDPRRAQRPLHWSPQTPDEFHPLVAFRLRRPIFTPHETLEEGAYIAERAGHRQVRREYPSASP